MASSSVYFKPHPARTPQFGSHALPHDSRWGYKNFMTKWGNPLWNKKRSRHCERRHLWERFQSSVISLRSEKKQKKSKYRNQLNVNINVHLINGLGMESTACWIELMPEAALTSFTVCDAYRDFVGQALLLTSKSRSRRQYLIPTDNIIVLDHLFNMWKKSNLIVIL